MKPKTFDAATIPEEKILLADKLRYEKDGTSIVSMAMSKKFCAYAFAVEIGGEMENIVVCNGKLTRSERRKVVKGALACFKFDCLTESEFLAKVGVKNVRGVVLQFKDLNNK